MLRCGDIILNLSSGTRVRGGDVPNDQECDRFETPTVARLDRIWLRMRFEFFDLVYGGVLSLPSLCENRLHLAIAETQADLWIRSYGSKSEVVAKT